MNKYTKKIENDKIIFSNLTDNTEIIIKHYDNKNSFDILYIDNHYELSFIEFVVEELKKTKDIYLLISNFYSPQLEEKLFSKGFRVMNHDYLIEKNSYVLSQDYVSSDKLDKEGIKFYLEKLNESVTINRKHYNPDKNNNKITESVLKNDKFAHKIYKKDGKIVGIVDYVVFEDNKKENTFTYDETYNNILCIRSLLSKYEILIEDILKDLANIYQRDIVISILYTEDKIRKVINKLGGKLKCSRYVLINEN